MTREEKINIMHELELLDDNHYGSLLIDKLIKFAELIAAAERERCAVKCEEWRSKLDNRTMQAEGYAAQELAEEIRKLK